MALSDPLRMLAQPFETLERRGDKHICREIAQIVEQQDVDEVVIGLPMDMSGHEGPSAQKVRAFSARLGNYLRVPIAMWDERLSTVAAERMLVEARVKRKRRKQVIDQAAAALLLEAYMASKPPVELD